MKKHVLLFTLLTGGVSGMMAQDGLQTVFESINTEVLSNSKAYETLKESTISIGHRLTGSVNGKKAEQQVFDLLKSYGYQDVRFQPFEVESWSRGHVHLDLLSTSGEKIEELKAVTLAHSPVRVNESAEIVDMGSGLEEDYLANPGKAKGKIVLASLWLSAGSKPGTQNLHRSEKTALAIKYGAKGIMLFNGVKNGVLLTGTASVTGKLNPIPAVCITNEDGLRLREMLKEKQYHAKLSMDNHSGPIKARNVIATLPGTKYPNEKIIVCGHLDSWDLATGATDNGLGSFAIVDMARTFKKLNLKTERTIEFVLFMGEEQGLLGSRAYVADAIKKKSLDQVKYVFNFDMSANAIGFTAGGRKEAEAFFKSTGEAIKAIDTVFQNKTSAGGAGLHSDHQPFMLQGIPTATSVTNIPSEVFRCYHADCDDINLINRSWMVDQVRFSTMFLYAIGNAAELPAKRMDDATTKQFLIDNKLKEALQIAGDWRWKGE
ncbi:M20/M25/M40 family metallo-hydrolase [Pseudobacter ginsenosidimutans]|jgi:Iap family predicted aminopeptidase|uniref:Carboxypeptidase Q n=2 Tax=Pseudobacter ginsenosidimutans TaxID=661488 RepID=A0A4Q7MRM6_9BACT|nr:M20/M25/M40 family metallo-hydrolase [Pseudobacter ginsenosidimutans]RZS71247.1 PA domain-containing protein [Pseudobacter ginsenosidimutans]